MAVKSLDGPVNATAPLPVRNAEFAETLARRLGRPALLPVPAAVLELAFGELAREVILGGQRVYPQKAIESGFAFHYPDLDSALKQILGRRRAFPAWLCGARPRVRPSAPSAP